MKMELGPGYKPKNKQWKHNVTASITYGLIIEKLANLLGVFCLACKINVLESFFRNFKMAYWKSDETKYSWVTSSYGEFSPFYSWD